MYVWDLTIVEGLLFVGFKYDDKEGTDLGTHTETIDICI